MLLLIDAGNTRVKWALTDVRSQNADTAGNWIASGAVLLKDIGQLSAAWLQKEVDRVLFSNVAGQQAEKDLERVIADALGVVRIDRFQSQLQAGGVRNGYRSPGQLGCDRFASAIGGHALFPEQHLIVATCGTATTIDAVTANGVFLGGMILPGLGLMAGSLAKNTAQLPQVAHDINRITMFADNTNDAIVGGCISAQVGAIERAAEAMRHRYGTVQCIISGGAAAMIAPHVSVSCVEIENLVLIGLHTVAMNDDTPC